MRYPHVGRGVAAVAARIVDQVADHPRSSARSPRTATLAPSTATP
jgi:hypothetical protein